MSLQIVSSDSHVVEPPNLWQQRVDARYRDSAPRLERRAEGDIFHIGDITLPLAGCASRTGARFEADGEPFSLAGSYDKVRPGASDPGEMLKDMDLDGVYAQVLYPTQGLGLFVVPDGELLSALFGAYNDWLGEFTSESPKRLKGIALVNVDDVRAGVGEMERAARIGLAGCAITVAPPPGHPYSSPEYEPLWAAAQDLQLPLSFHVGTNRPGTGFDLTDLCCIRPSIFCTFDTWVRTALGDMILSGVFERYPEVRAGSIEHDAAWVPFWLWKMDAIYRDYAAAMQFPSLGDGMLPSDYFHRNAFVSFQEDVPAIEQRHTIGVENLTFGTDYPHMEGTFPKTRAVLSELLAVCTAEERAKIAGGNAARIYGFDS